MGARELVRVIAEALVDQVDAIEVTESDRKEGVLVELTVAKPDIGKVIGKDGRTAQAIRAVLSAAGQKVGRRYHLDILD